jgi:Multicopper oxidase
VVAGRFSDYTGKFVIHCHMLDHEDHGLMSQFEVVARPSPLVRGPPAGALDPEVAHEARLVALDEDEERVADAVILVLVRLGPR